MRFLNGKSKKEFAIRRWRVAKNGEGSLERKFKNMK